MLINRNYYGIYYKKELICIVLEKDLGSILQEKYKNNKNVWAKRINDQEIDDFLEKDIKKIFLPQEKEDLKKELFIKEIVDDIKNQLIVKDDLDIVIPREAIIYIPEIENELKKDGIILKHSLSECIEEETAYQRFQKKLKKDKELIKEAYLGREKK